MRHLKHIIGASILVALLTAGLGFWLQTVQAGMPQLASQQGFWVDQLFTQHFWLIAFLFSLIAGFMLYSIVVFRRKPGEEGDGEYIEGHTGLEILWTIVPLIVVVYFSFIGGSSLANIESANLRAQRIDVYGSQWTWKFQYPDVENSQGEAVRVYSDVLMLPENTQVVLRLRSRDVIHSFWVPEFRIKQDLLPGDELRELRITATELGEYTVRCAELCGKEHALMLGNVEVVTREAYADWLLVQADIDVTDIDDPAVRGEIYADRAGCIACHSTNGAAGQGPTWQGLFLSERIFTDGSTAVADEAYLFKSIRDPEAQIVDGLGVSMPAGIADSLTDTEVEDIIAFIQSIQ
jgi:cytochrome c oxidase subunit 2